MGFFEKIKKLLLRKSYQTETFISESQNKDNAESLNEGSNSKTESIYYQEKEIIDERFMYGYLLKTLKSIEDSLKRIEYNMITKDWASLNLTEKKDLNDLLNKLEEKIENFRLIVPTALSASSRSSSRVNEIIKKAIEIIKNKKEIGYDDLAKELGISSSYLRAIASLIEMNSNEIKRIIKDKKGFFMYEDKSSENIGTASTA